MAPPTATLALLAGVSAAALAGCGGGRATPAHAPPVSGRAVFSQECTACHSLSGAETSQLQGGDLLGYRFSRVTLTQFTREMPVRHRLNAAQVRAVVDYVKAAQDAAARR